MVNSNRVAVFSGNLQESLRALDLIGFHVEEFTSFEDFFKIRRNA
jgi:hypothetical protein